MISYLRNEILSLNNYQIPDSNNSIKLDAMELPFGLDEDTKKELKNILAEVEINRYPCNHDELKRVIKELMGIDNELDILLGNGSDELIQMIMLGLKKDTEILSFSPSFVMYEMIATWCNLNFNSIALDENFDINIDKTLNIINNNRPQVIFIAYPNNPTGNCFNAAGIKKILATNAVVVIDEAYYAYNDKSFISQINKYNNLIVLRTVSKIGFAGLRLGIMIGRKNIIAEFNKLRMPYNINSLTLNAAKFLLKKQDIITKNTNIIRKNKIAMIAELSKIQQIKLYPTDANFILFHCNQANDLYDFLLKNNILVKNLNKSIKNSLRVNISTMIENNLLITKIKEFYGKNSN